MSDVLKIRLRPDDPGAHDRLGRIINVQTAADRLARRRHLWTAIVAIASIPVSLPVWKRAPAPDLVAWSLAVWATALLAAVGSGLAEFGLRQRLKSLLAQAAANVRALE
jgi:hypothetical protein